MHVFECLGSASPGSRPSYRADQRGACVEVLYREECGGEDPGGRTLQTQRGREGHPGRHVRPEVNGLRAPGVPEESPDSGRGE